MQRGKVEMNERENFINNFERAINSAYGEGRDFVKLTIGDMKRILQLIKEQEPVLLENQHKPYGHFTNANAPWISRCPRCGKKVEGRQSRFCKYCGLAVKWE